MRWGQALDIDAAEELETAEEATTAIADDEDLQLAMRVVKAMRTERDEVDSFIKSSTINIRRRNPRRF